ncbi:MAG: N-acetyltransferase [Gammaproteobacteria bacterium]
MIRIRSERPAEADAIRSVNLAAFPARGEADLVDRLRRDGDAMISLVAVADGELVGHVLVTPVTSEPPDPENPGAAVAPIAVRPPYQGRGIGARLMLAALEVCRDHGIRWLLVLGPPAFLSRFGFRPAVDLGVADNWNGGRAFQALELRPGALAGETRLVHYAPAFRDLVPMQNKTA